MWKSAYVGVYQLLSTRNIFWGVKAVGAYGWQPYHLHVPTVLKSGNLNLLEPSGPVQVCNGIAIPVNKKEMTDSELYLCRRIAT